MSITTEYLILGGTESVGYAFSMFLLENKIPFTLLTNNPGHVDAIFKESKLVRLIKGDALEPELLRQEARDKRYIFMGDSANRPYWEKNAITITKNIIDAAAGHQTMLIYPGAVLQFTGNDMISEQSTPRPFSRSAVLEVKLEDMMLDAVVEKKCRVLVIRLPALYGPAMSDTDLRPVFINAVQKKTNSYPVNADIPRQFAYTKDVACILFRLLRQQRLGFFSIINIGGQTYPSARKFIQEVHSVAGSEAEIRILSKGRIKLFSIFKESWKELNEKVNFFEQPFLLDDSYIRQLFPGFKLTTSSDAIAATLQWFRKNGFED
jgi:nucleoside-diphosphate-sugar epimerase